MAQKDGLQVSLPYRPPFDFAWLLRYYRSHVITGLEVFEDNSMQRIIEFDGKVGRVIVRDEPDKSRLLVEIDFPDAARVPEILARVRAMFDLDSDPVLIANALGKNPELKKLVKKYPGVRLFSGWDPFEGAIASILGQFVSVERARALTNDVVQNLGSEAEWQGQKIRLFPRPEQIAGSDLEFLKTTGARKKTLISLARAVGEGRISLDAAQEIDAFNEKIRGIPGIGPWTANVMALKVLRHTDAFPETDLILARVLEIHPKEGLEVLRPWRAYAAALFWREYAGQLKKAKSPGKKAKGAPVKKKRASAKKKTSVKKKAKGPKR